MTTRYDSLMALMMTEPVVYAAMTMHRSNPAEFTFEDALMAMVLILAEQNRGLIEKAIAVAERSVGKGYNP